MKEDSWIIVVSLDDSLSENLHMKHPGKSVWQINMVWLSVKLLCLVSIGMEISHPHWIPTCHKHGNSRAKESSTTKEWEFTERKYLIAKSKIMREIATSVSNFPKAEKDSKLKIFNYSSNGKESAEKDPSGKEEKRVMSGTKHRVWNIIRLTIKRNIPLDWRRKFFILSHRER